MKLIFAIKNKNHLITNYKVFELKIYISYKIIFYKFGFFLNLINELSEKLIGINS